MLVMSSVTVTALSLYRRAGGRGGETWIGKVNKTQLSLPRKSPLAKCPEAESLAAVSGGPT